MKQEKEELEGELVNRLLHHLINMPWTNADSLNNLFNQSV